MANPFPFVAGEVLTAAELNGIGEWTSYTPVLTASVTNPTLGTGSTQSGSYARIQNLIIYRYFVGFGTSGVNAGAGNYKISLPVASSGITSFYENNIGSVAFFDTSANSIYYANAWIADVNNVTPIYQATFNGALLNVTAAVPVVPAAQDALSGLVVYRAA
jgi:hypothetical protein